MATAIDRLHTAPRASNPHTTVGNLRDDRGESLAQGLGWFSLALGAAALLAPNGLARAAGVREHSALVRAIGLREIGSAAAILKAKRPNGAIQGRVAADVMDLALLAVALPGSRDRRRTAMAIAAVAGVMVLDVLASQQLNRGASLGHGATVMPDGRVVFTKAIAVNATPQRCYELWRDFERLPTFMKHLESVTMQGEKRSHWVARGPAGMRVEWDAETTADIPGRTIAWRSIDGPNSTIRTSGSVNFEPAPANRGALVRANIQYRPPAGAAGAWLAKLFGREPTLQVPEDLRRFKRLVETGEIPTTEGQSHGPRSRFGTLASKVARA